MAFFDELDVDGRIGYLCNEMLRNISIPEFRDGLADCMTVVERRSYFVETMISVGRRSFLWYGMGLGDRTNLMNGIYMFSGRIWEQMDGALFKQSLRMFCVKKLGMSPNEWLRDYKLLMSSVRDGAMLSPLEVHKGIVAFENGVYDFTDVDNIVFHRFDERLHVTTLLPYSYDVRDDCPLWKEFLRVSIGERQMGILQRFVGLGVADRSSLSAKIENSLWFVGPGGSGKSTTMNVIRYVFGEDNISGIPLSDLLAGNSDTRARFMSRLNGKVFNFCPETSRFDMTYGADAFKSLCSGEEQPMRVIGGNVEMCREVPYLLFSMNRKPKLRNIDSALLRRLIFISYRIAVRAEDRDPNLEKKLMAEASGIRNWILEGFRSIRKDDFKLFGAQSSALETDAWLIENEQTVELFMRKNGLRHYQYMGESDSSRWIPVKILYERYSAFCNKWGYERDVDLSGMGRELSRIGFTVKRMSSGMAYKVYGADGFV